MLTKTLDGIEYEWRIPERIAKGSKRKTSKGHATARRLIKELWPTCRYYEEVPITIDFSGRKEINLYLDFYIPSLNLAVEIQGSQHFNYSSFFYKTKLEFLKAQQRDRNKVEWCQLNGIKLITLPYSQTEDEWKAQLMTSC